ncbi:hypothetical protein RND81_04G055300 [Saponaria officinalis]|uniref:Enhancer of polycomb-like protein n=1 Tax=Saponaria officinalis TaxID=3572 RepID=A0AAW1LIU3_SAPOF
MPSVEMRRSTRVFVPKSKDGDLVKVLRSGRRLWGEINQHRTVKDEWFPLIDDRSNCKQQPEDRNIPTWDDNATKHDPMNIEEGKTLREYEKTMNCVEDVGRNRFRVIKNVYSRKRKRCSGFMDGSRKVRKFGLYFVRRPKRNVVQGSMERNKGFEIEGFGDENVVLTIAIEACAGCSVVSCLLGCMLTHLGKGNVGFTRLSAFLVSSPITSVFASYGVRFLFGHKHLKNRGFCKISWKRQSMLSFTIDFSAIPLCFLGFHSTLSLRSVRLSYLFWINFYNETGSTHDDDGQRDHMLSVPIVPNKDERGMKIIVAALESGKVGSRTVHYRSLVLTRSALKRRRRSLRNRRARNPSHFVMQKGNGLPVSNNVLFKKKGLQLPHLDLDLRRSARKNPSSKISAPKSRPNFVIEVPKSSSSNVVNVSKSSPTSVSNMPNSSSSSASLNLDTNFYQCSVNILVVETDRCYRVERAEVALDLSNEWVLAVRKDGMTRYQLKVQKEMRPNTVNRFTHAIVWTIENGWKLEFPNRKDWSVFKELYKVCAERNVVPTSPVVKNIPVPGVSEVADFLSSANSFERPESYIRLTSDELSRVLSRGTANYDLDLEDEDWVCEFNRGLNEANFLSEENFELMIDAFEKASYFSPEIFNDENNAVSLCLDLASAEATMLVYKYWLKRREQKHGPMLRVFELNEPKRAQVITTPVLRKKRSLKRGTACQSLQRGRGKDNSILQAIAVEQTVLEEQHAVLRVQEARASADKLVEVAILKRQRAQFLMENADLALYQATMSLRIADAATSCADSQQAARHFLD